MGVIGTSGLLISDLPEGSKGKKRSELIRTSAEQARALNTQLASLVSGSTIKSEEPLHISSLVEDIALLLKTALFKKASFNTRLDPDVPLIEGNEGILRRTLVGLVAKPRDAVLDKNGSVNISTGSIYADADYLQSYWTAKELKENTYTVLEVADTRVTNETPLESESDSRLIFLRDAAEYHQGSFKISRLPEGGIAFRILFPCWEKVSS